MNPEISIVIPCLTGDDVEPLLRSLERQRDVPAFEVHLVFNPKAPQRPPQDRRNIHVWTVALRGVNRARNFGAAQAQGKWIYFIDADCVLRDPVHLRRLYDRLSDLSSDTLLGGPYRLGATNSPYSLAYHAVQIKWLREGAHIHHGQIHLLGGNLAVDRIRFLESPFDESIVFGGSETDFLARWMGAGGRGLFFSELSLEHRHSLSRKQFIRKAFLQGYNHERLIQRGPHPRPLWRGLASHAQKSELRKMLSLYGRVFDDGRSYYHKRPEAPPSVHLMNLYRLKRNLICELARMSYFGQELLRILHKEHWPYLERTADSGSIQGTDVNSR